MIQLLPRRSKIRQKISCSATNSVSGVKTTNIQLQLIYKPEVTLSQTNKLTAMAGEEVLMSCKLRANPEVTNISWFINTKQLALESRPTLTLSGISHDYYGASVQCRATNMLGEGRDQVKLEFKCKVLYRREYIKTKTFQSDQSLQLSLPA